MSLDLHPGAPPQMTFVITVTYSEGLSFRRAGIIRRTCKRYGLSHADPTNADKAAATISRLREVDRCTITQVWEKHCATFRKGTKS